MNISLSRYREKVKGCWLGKNIGGTLGAPFECYRGVFDITTYTQDLSNGPPPNDDLDLQLLWLIAAEEYGKALNAHVLGEYWLSYVTADWSEYGAGKNNMRMGILPPLSGSNSNHNKDSNGAFIRSEIWACLMPGRPELAVRYAYEDAIVDHGDEGVYAEIFCAAMESAAFAQSDLEKLIEIGLTYIPEDCAVAEAVQTARKCFSNGLDWKAARKRILQKFPTAFGMYHGYLGQEPEPDVPVGKLGFDAPASIGLIIIGLLYGDGDFGKSVCIAASCGEDTDCTAATIGALLGIILGANSLPEEWTAPIGEDIKIGCVSLNHKLSLPQTISELTDRTVRAMPVFMGEHFDLLAHSGDCVSLCEGNELSDSPIPKGVLSTESFRDYLRCQPYGIKMDSPLLRVVVTVDGGVNISEGSEKKIRIQFDNKHRIQQWVTVKWRLPSEWLVSPCIQTNLYLEQAHGGTSLSHADYSLVPNGLAQGKYDVLLEIIPHGRISRIFVPITLIVEGNVKKIISRDSDA